MAGKKVANEIEKSARLGWFNMPESMGVFVAQANKARQAAISAVGRSDWVSECIEDIYDLV